MKRLLKFGMLLQAVLACNAGMAQLERSHIPPSPNASPVVEAANIDVSHYSGVANVSVPLHNVSGKGIAIPILLSYQTTGIKVQDVATSVGLGWNLNASSFAITRVVRGLPDGLERNCNTDANGKISRNEVWETHFESCDAERDLFYFSYPSRSGKMFLDNAGKPQTMPYQDLRISPGVGSQSVGYWKIIDESGYTYYFGDALNSTEETTYFTGDYETDSFTEKFAFTSTWFLTRIVSPSGDEVATFSYNVGSNVAYFRPAARVLECKSSPDPIPHTRVDAKIQINSPKYVATISTDISSCVFDYDNNRQDLPGALRLASVSFKDDANNAIKKFHFTAGCFQVYSGLGACRRLKLQSLKEGVTNPVTTHTFVYKEDGSLPVEMSFYTDHYGYFNVNSSDENVAASGGRGYAEHSVAQVPSVCTTGRNKEPNQEALNAILTEIQLASGAKTVFGYEVEAGARVASISYYNEANLIGKSTFSYTGETYKAPVYHYYNIENDNSLIRSSNSYNSIFDLNGVNKAYGTVTETLLDGSKVVRTFYNFSDYPDDPPIVARYRGTTTVTFQATSNVDSSPFTPYSSKARMRGLPKSVSIIDAENNTLNHEDFFYDSGPVISTAWNMAVEAYRTEPGDYAFYVGDYMLRSQPVYLRYKKTFMYDQSDFSRSLVGRTDYDYHETYRTFPKSIISYVGEAGPQQKITFKYPIDLTGVCVEEGTCTPPSSYDDPAGGIWALAVKHVITPVEKLFYLKDWSENAFNITGAELYTYKKATPYGQPIAKGLYKLDLNMPISSLSTETTLTSEGTVFSYDNTRYRLLKEFTYNESADILTSTSDHQGIVYSYEYGHNNSLVTATSTLIGGTPQYRKQYSYNTINGLESVTDANQISTSYAYDRFGRLKLIKDDEQKIVTRYRYNAANVNEFSVAFSISSTYAMTGTAISFSSTDNAETSGITKYVWDFGDGQVLEETTGSVSHTYTSAGTFTVKLSKINPEYGTVMTTAQLTTYPPPSVYIDSSCGPIDLCSSSSTSCDFTAVGSGGCSTQKSYQWFYSTDDAVTWSYLGSSITITFGFSYEGEYLFKCVISDTCGNSSESPYSVVRVYKSDPNCSY